MYSTDTIPVRLLRACSPEIISQIIQVVTPEFLSGDVYVELPASEDLEVTQVYPAIDVTKTHPVAFSREGKRPRIKIAGADLNQQFGRHAYIVEVTWLGEACKLYFGYYLQTDEVEKPYIYMNRGDE